nr:tyrosine protein kinase Abl [Hymenolepis microstoma]
MGANIVKPASSKDGSEKTEFSSNFNQQIDDISMGGECLSSTSVEKQLHNVASGFDSTNSTDQCIMIVLYDFSATLDSQLTVKRGEIVRLLGYSPAGDWSEVEAPSRLPNRNPRVAWANGTNSGWVRGWVPTSYLTEHIRPAPPLSNATASPFTNAADWRTHVSNESTLVASDDASTYPWYHGAVSRQAAEQLLRSGITGSYLVRESESAPGQLSVTVRNLGRVYHYRISRDTCGWYFITETHRFPTVVQLIHHHSQAADGLICPLLYPAARREQHSLLRGGTANSIEGGGGNVGLDDWEIDRSEIMMRNKLGWGQYGDVYEALWRRYNSIVAVKTLKQDVDLNLNDFLAEASIMKNLQHKNLVRLLGVCTREPPYYIVTEYMPHGNLLNYLRQRSPGELTPPVLLYMAVQIASGMAYLEANNFIHRDLAARNCLVGDQHTIKVADFGLARYMQLHEDTYTARNGAKFPIKWTAPEGLAYFRFSSKSDVWAFGVVLWELATYGLSPYPGVELHGVYQLLEKGYRMQRPHGCPESVYSIMLRCWSWEAADRPTFAEIKAELEEMWRTIDMAEAVAQELAAQPIPQPNSDPTMHFTGTAAVMNPALSPNCNPGSMGSGVEAMMASRMAPALPTPAAPTQRQNQHVGGGVERGRLLTPSCSSSASESSSPPPSSSSSPSSPGRDADAAGETDGQDGDDEGEGEILRSKSPAFKSGIHSTGSWSTSRTTPTDGCFYQGDYIVNGALGRVAPASDLPLPANASSITRDSQLSAPASLPPQHHIRQQLPQPSSRHRNGVINGHHHHHNRHYHQQQQEQSIQGVGSPSGGRNVPRRRSGGPNNKHFDLRSKEKSNITPAESGVGESIVSADSPGGDSNTKQTQPSQSSLTKLEASVVQQKRNNGGGRKVVITKDCVTPTRDLMTDGMADERRMRLDAESVTQFTTLPAQDRITRYLESLGELGSAPSVPSDERRLNQRPDPNKNCHLQMLPHFPPPPPVPSPPPQTPQQQQQFNKVGRIAPPSEGRWTTTGRSASCYQTVSPSQLPVPTNPMKTNGSSSSKQEPSSINSQPNPNAVAVGIAESVTPTDDVYQAPNLTQGNVSNSKNGMEEVTEQAELTACLNNLSLEANQLSSTCPDLAPELSALSQQLSVCRSQIESCLLRDGDGVSLEEQMHEDQCLAGIATALRHIKQSLSGMRARLEVSAEKEGVPPTVNPTPVST